MDVRDYQLRAQVAKAMAHPSRMLILDALQKKEMCVNELTELVGADQSTVSKHIAILKNAGIILDRKQGNSTYYKLVCPCIQNFLDCLERVLANNLERYHELYSSKKSSKLPVKK